MGGHGRDFTMTGWNVETLARSQVGRLKEKGQTFNVEGQRSKDNDIQA
jgi:hypothetical protein